MMRVPSRYVQVTMTYTRPWALRFWFICTVAFVTWIAVVQKVNYAARFAVLMLGGSLAAWAGPIVAAHVKEQMADWRSRLTPGYRTPHLLVAAAIFVLGVGGITWYAVYRLNEIPAEVGWPSIPVSLYGFFALILLATTLLAWMAHSQSVIFIFVVMGSTAIALIPRGQEIIRQMVAGERHGLAWTIMAASMAGLVLLWCRLARMHEEMGEYWKLETFNTRLRVAMTGDRYMRRAAALETGWLAGAARGVYRLDRVTNISAASFWRRARHWTLVVNNAHANWTLSLMIAVGIMLVYYFGVDHRRNTQIGLLVAIPAFLSLVIPILMATATWPHRWFVIADESLRPVASRATFLCEQAAAKAMEVVSFWFWLTLGAYLPGLFICPDLILSRPTAAALVLNLATQVFLFGVAVWMLHLRRSWFINFGAMIGSLIISGALLAWQIGGEKQALMRTPSPIWAVVMVVVGTLIILDAYRRWKITDLD
jgi:hypothetical protein